MNNWKIVNSRELLIGLENFVQGYRDSTSSTEETHEMTYNNICDLLFERGLPAYKDDAKPADEEESISGKNSKK